MTPPPALTICICTLDRVQVLGAVLESLACEPGITGQQVLVVNNAPSERCLDVIAAFEPRLTLRYLQVPERALGVARNRGWQEAASPLVAYLDDDALAQPGWLAAVLDAFSHPEVVAATGPVLPTIPYEEMPPFLLRSVANVAFSLLPERASGPLVFPGGVIGNNMAFRRSFLAEVGGFSPDLQNYDEAFVSWQAIWLGRTIYFHERMRISHTADLARLEPGRMRARWAAQGAAFQKLLEQLDRYPKAPSMHTALTAWVRPLAVLVVSTLRRDCARQLAGRLGLGFALARLRRYIGLRPTDDFYEKPVAVPTER